MRYHGFSCHLVRKRNGTVEHDAFDEIGVEEDRGNYVISCWVSCQAGEEFCVVWKDERRNSELDGLDGSKGTVRIDGQICGKREATDDYLQRFWGVSVGDGLKQPLSFSNAVDNVTEDEFEARADAGRLSGLGTIELTIQRGVVEKGAFTSVRSKKNKFSDGTPNSVLRSGPRYTEEAKIATDISHTVRFGKPVASANFHKFRSKDFAGGIHPDRVGWLEPHPFVTFRFKYRSRQFLASNGHVIDNGSTYRNGSKKASYWEKADTRTIPDNVEIIAIDSGSDEDESAMDVDSRYDRARSRTRFSTEPINEDPEQLERDREMLRAKLEI